MKPETIENILNFLKEKEDKELPNRWLKFLSKQEVIKELENHPDGVQYRHNSFLDLRNTNIKKLPNDLYVDGNFNLRGCEQITELPNKLFVGGYLSLLNCEQITELPDGIHVGGDLNLSGINITKLPDDLYVGGVLDLIDCKRLTELPNNLYVEYGVLIEGTPLVQKYSDKEIKDIVASKGGTIKGRIIRTY